jgi:hypothetical protein
MRSKKNESIKMNIHDENRGTKSRRKRTAQ